jgi:TPR repeat protein
MRRYRTISIAFVATAGPLLSVLSGDIARAGTDQALAAYQRGDLATGLKELEAGAAAGEPEAFYNLGITYALGAGVAVDLKKAAAYFLQGADRGNVYAAFEIGESYWTAPLE